MFKKSIRVVCYKAEPLKVRSVYVSQWLLHLFRKERWADISTIQNEWLVGSSAYFGRKTEPPHTLTLILDYTYKYNIDPKSEEEVCFPSGPLGILLSEIEPIINKTNERLYREGYLFR